MLSNKKAIIFDLDGTLIHSMWIWEAVDKEYSKLHNLQAPDGFYEAMEGMSYTEVATHYVDTFPHLDRTVDDIKSDWLVMTEDMYRNQVTLKPFVREFLEHASALGLKMGIATSSAKPLVLTVLESHDILKYFDTIVTSCEVGAGKPAPDVYLKAASDLGISAGDCIVFEDVPNGVRAGKNAGMTTCAIEDINNEKLREKLREIGNYYIKTYEDVINKTHEVL